MKEYLFCDRWSFAKTGLGEEMPASERFCRVALPHDWLIYQVQDLYENSTGWYKRELSMEELQGVYGYRKGERVLVSFDGVYMDSTKDESEAGESLCTYKRSRE